MSITNLSVLFGVLGVLLLVISAFAIVSYILTALSFFTVARRRKISAPWMAWIPVVQFWTLGGICDHYDAARGFKRNWRKVLLILIIVVLTVGVLFEGVAVLQTIGIAASYQNYNYLEDWELISAFAGIYGMLILMIVVASALHACQTVCLFKFFESCRPDDAVKFLLLSLLVPFASPFCLMSCRKYDLGLPEQPEPDKQLPPLSEPQ